MRPSRPPSRVAGYEPAAARNDLPHLLAGAAMALAVWGQAGAELLRIESPPTQATLVELYTSEGCSSCPPADRWLSGLEESPRLWQDLVPVAFHVDYWNQLGWRDRFSAARYSRRQRDYARHGLLDTVYTPGFVVNGREWRGWFSRRGLEAGSRRPAGRLAAALSGDELRVRYRPVDSSVHPLTLHIALLGFDLATQVRRGENRGRLLEHDFVVLGHTAHALAAEGDRYRLTARLPGAAVDAPRRAVALWVTAEGDPRPLQAAGGWLGR